LQPAYSENQLTGKPLEHYQAEYEKLDSLEVAARTGLPYDEASQEFTYALMGETYRAAWPKFAITEAGTNAERTMPYEAILMMRYMCEARPIPPTGTFVAYKELPWGATYDANFQGRVIRRFIYEFARTPNDFIIIMETNAGLNARKLEKCDAGYEFDFIGGEMPLRVQIKLWEADEEFPASAQVLFDKNFEFAFTAEDVAVVGDIMINHLKALRTHVIASEAKQSRGKQKCK
jgi:hypothetical protein